MANAKQCDRCGKFYSVDDLDNEYFTVAIKNKLYGTQKTNFDVCPDCEAELRAWSNGDKKLTMPVEETDKENEDDVSPFTASWVIDMESNASDIIV